MPESASVLARSSGRFVRWACGTGMIEIPDAGSIALSARSAFKEFNQLKLPNIVITGEDRPGLPAGFFSELHKWGKDNPTLVQNEDNHRFSTLLPILKIYYHAIKDSVSNSAKAVARRRGVDGMVELAFSYRDVNTFDVDLEYDLRLPLSTDTEIQVRPHAIVSNLVTLPMPAKKMGQLVDFYARNISALDQGYWTKFPWSSDLTLIIFPGEFTRDPKERNKNHLVMDLSTAQHQRRALGLADTFIWGATYSEGIFELYYSRWLDSPSSGASSSRINTIFYSDIHRWNLINAAEFLLCYATLCNLAKDQESLVPLLEALDPPAVLESLTANRWRAPTPPSSDAGSKMSRSHRDDDDGVRHITASQLAADPGGPLSGDDLDSNEDGEWRKAASKWVVEARQAARELEYTGGPLFEYRVKAHTELNQPTDDRERGVKRKVGEWLSDVSS